MHGFIIIYSVLIDPDGVYERRSGSLLKVVYRILNNMRHGLKSDLFFRYVFMKICLRCPVCKYPSFNARRIFLVTKFINNIVWDLFLLYCLNVHYFNTQSC